MPYVDLRPNNTRPVRVLVADTWRDGELEAYRQESGGSWLGWVRWSEGVGLNHLDWFGEEAFESIARA